MTTKALLIAGPTAGGKSALALNLARRLGGMVINADSMQVYAELSILTARPDAQAMATAPHRLYGVLGASEICSAARWVGMARTAIEEAKNLGLLPVVVGGTGLYLRALSEGLAEIPPIPDAVRGNARALMAEVGPARFHEILTARDLRAGDTIRPTDTQRLVRAYEVLEATGRLPTDWHKGPPTDPGPAIDWYRFALMPDRGDLHAAINARFDKMIATGALDEARAVAALNLDPSLPLTKALGLRPLIAYLDGQISLDAARARAQTDTRRYAKRQMTWIRTQMISWNVIFEQDMESKIRKICTFIENSR